MNNLARKEELVNEQAQLIEFPANPENPPKRHYFRELFGGTVSFWKLVAFFSILTLGANLLTSDIVLDLILVSNPNFDLAYLPTVYGVTTLIWGLALTSAIVGVKLTQSEDTNVNAIISSAMLAATIPALHLLTSLIPEFISPNDGAFKYYGTFYVTIIVGLITSFLALNYAQKVWRQADAKPIGAFIGSVAFATTATILFELIA